MSPTVSRMELIDWFKLVWRDTEGAVKLAYQTSDLAWKNVMFNWPASAEKVVDWVLAKTGTGSEVFYAPAVFKNRNSGKPDNVLGSWVLWVDFDGNGPAEWTEVSADVPQPSVRIQSSLPGNQHCYWMLDEFIDREALEGKNRTLAYELQADTSGWDAGQVLRPPETTNFGHAKEDRETIHSVQILDMSKEVYEPSFIECPTYFVDVVKNSIDPGNLPELGLVLAKGRFADKFYESFFKTTPPEKGIRSDAIMEIAYFGAEAGLGDSEIYSLVVDVDARWGKYVNRTADKKHAIYSDFVERARQKHPYGHDDLVTRFNKGKIEKPTQIVYTYLEFLEEKRNLEWEYKKLAIKNGFGIFAGEPGVGKTQIFNQFARATAAGSDFLVWENAGQPRRVLFLSLEMPFTGLQYFMEAADKSLGDERKLIAENLMIAPLSTALPLDTDQGKKFLIDLTVQHEPEFVIIDSLTKSTHAALTDETAMRRLNDFIQEFRERYNTSFSIVHHTKKAQLPNKPGSTNGLDDMYGSRFLAGDLDFLLTFAKAKPKGTIYCRHAKSRYGEEHDDFTIIRDPATLTFDVGTIFYEEDQDEDPGSNFVRSFLDSRSGSPRGHGPGTSENGFGIGWATNSD